MNVDDRRFLRRHLPSFVTLGKGMDEVEQALGGVLPDAVRHDGMVFYTPKGSPNVWVGWLERTGEGVLRLKDRPATRALCTVDEYIAELDARDHEARQLLGQKVRIR